MGIKGVSKGPHTPGGRAVDGDIGSPIPLKPEPIVLEGIAGIDGIKVGGPVMPKGGGSEVGPLPGAGIAP